MDSVEGRTKRVVNADLPWNTGPVVSRLDRRDDDQPLHHSRVRSPLSHSAVPDDAKTSPFSEGRQLSNRCRADLPLHIASPNNPPSMVTPRHC